MAAAVLTLLVVGLSCTESFGDERPNIVLVMADDQGWGEMGYYSHPVLKTPNLDAMANHGLRFDRFYAGAPNCSPTRATVMTGRSNDRTGVLNHGYPLRKQEKTVAQALQQAGYATGHFGKWHLNGLRGPGVPILASDDHHPGEFGFDTWLSVTNFFDLNPIMSRGGEFVEFSGDSSEISVAEALEFIGSQTASEQPFFVVIWYGTPHSPFMATEEDMAQFSDLKAGSKAHYAELVAMDRSIGALRAKLRELQVSENTLFWYCSDNGGLPGIEPATVGGLRGFKNSVYEGGLRVPAIIEWPAVIQEPRVTDFPACTMDIFATLADIAGLPSTAMLQPQDGHSLRKLFESDISQREKPIPFRHQQRGAWVDNQYKLVIQDISKPAFELYDLASDPHEAKDVSAQFPKVADRLNSQFRLWSESVDESATGKDYPEGEINPGEPKSRFWMEVDAYRPYFEAWKKRPEYRSRLTSK